jgi:hypothetical protein
MLHPNDTVLGSFVIQCSNTIFTEESIMQDQGKATLSDATAQYLNFWNSQ